MSSNLRALAFFCTWLVCWLSPAPSLAGTLPGPIASSSCQDALCFSISEKLMQSHFYRQGPVAAHVNLLSGHKPRLIIAFPAGNAGLGLWFAEQKVPVSWHMSDPVDAAYGPDELRGVTVKLSADTTQLTIDQVILGGIRFLREYQDTGTIPATLRVTQHLADGLWLHRQSFDGVHHYVAHIIPDPGTSIVWEKGHLVLRSQTPNLGIKLRAMSDETPLTPIANDSLFLATASDAPDTITRQALSFLTYQEKFLAGSWRFLTYFGRDTLLSLTLLMPILRPEAVEAGLRAVFDRVSVDGDVAHEEAIGDWAAFQHLRHATHQTKAQDLSAPIFDYKMVDDDFLLAPVAADYLLHTKIGHARAATFLQQKGASGASLAASLTSNIRSIMNQATAYAQTQMPRDLISLKAGEVVGDWRDSYEGLAHGRFSFSTNAAFVPAALKAAHELLASGLLNAAVGPAIDDWLKEAASLAEAWQGVHRHFLVRLPRSIAQARVETYAAELGLKVPQQSLMMAEDEVAFYGVSLDAVGRPTEIENSDIGLVMFFTKPDALFLTRALASLRTAFPLGLKTPVGYVVANPALCLDQNLRGEFTTDHYHGTVVWSWQHAMLLAGIRRQLARRDLSEITRADLAAAEEELQRIIKDTKAHQNDELWTFQVDKGRIVFAPFGQSAEHSTESNTIQLWSTMFLGIPP